jgi:hypothetical protein
MPSSEGGDITGSDHLDTVTPLDYILTEIKGNDGGFQRNFFFFGDIETSPNFEENETKPEYRRDDCSRMYSSIYVHRPIIPLS